MNNQQKIVVTLGVIATLAISGGVGYYLTATKDTPVTSATQQVPTVSNESSQTAPSPVASSTPTSTTANASSANAGYRDGVYITVASYRVPKHTNNINVSMTISGGVVAKASATHTYGDRESREYVDAFDESLTGSVVGKSVADLSPSRIGGASLTTEGFLTALDTIKSQAKQ